MRPSPVFPSNRPHLRPAARPLRAHAARRHFTGGDRVFRTGSTSRRAVLGHPPPASLAMAAQDFDLLHYFGIGPTLQNDLSRYDRVRVMNGNVVTLRRAMQKSGFDTVVSALLDRDAIVRAVRSAGFRHPQLSDLVAALRRRPRPATAAKPHGRAVPAGIAIRRAGAPRAGAAAAKLA